MRAGRLRHRVALQQRDPDPPSRGSAGGRVDAWSTVADRVPAEVRDLSGREFESAGQSLAEVTTRIRIRFPPSLAIGPEWRVLWNDLVYEVEHTADPDGRRRELILFCKALR